MKSNTTKSYLHNEQVLTAFLLADETISLCHVHCFSFSLCVRFFIPWDLLGTLDKIKKWDTSIRAQIFITYFMTLFMDPSSSISGFSLSVMMSKKGWLLFKNIFHSGYRTLSKSYGLHSLVLLIDESLLVYFFMVDHSPLVCFSHRKLIHGLGFETHESVIHFISICWPGFSVFLLPKLLITK